MGRKEMTSHSLVTRYHSYNIAVAVVNRSRNKNFKDFICSSVRQHARRFGVDEAETYLVRLGKSCDIGNNI